MTSTYQDALLTIVTDGDAQELEELRTQLFSEIEALDLHSIDLVSAGEAPDGTRGVDMAAIGQLLVKVGPQAAAALIRTVRNWVSRSTARAVEITIDGDTLKLGKASPADQEKLVAMFMAKHITDESQSG